MKLYHPANQKDVKRENFEETRQKTGIKQFVI